MFTAIRPFNSASFPGFEGWGKLIGKIIIWRIIKAKYESVDERPGKEVLPGLLPGRSESGAPWCSPYFGKVILDFVLIWLSVVS